MFVFQQSLFASYQKSEQGRDSKTPSTSSCVLERRILRMALGCKLLETERIFEG